MYSSGSTAWVLIDLFHHCCPLAELPCSGSIALPFKDVGLWSWLTAEDRHEDPRAGMQVAFDLDF